MRTIVSLLEIVRAGFVLISRCFPNGSDADAEPLLESGLRVLTMGERAGDKVGDMAREGEREGETVNPAGRARGYMISSSIAELEPEGVSWPSHLQVNAAGQLGSFFLRRHTYWSIDHL